MLLYLVTFEPVYPPRHDMLDRGNNLLQPSLFPNIHLYIFLIYIVPAFKMILKVTVPFVLSRHLAYPLQLNNHTTEPILEPLLGISG